MKRLVLFFAILMATQLLQAQLFNPVKWETSVEQIANDEFNLVATAKIDKGWHLYAQKVPKDGPIPTTFEFEKSTGYKLIEAPSEPIGTTVFDPIFEMTIKYFSDSTAFRQRIKTNEKSLNPIKAEVSFMVCDDKRCLPPKYVDLAFDLSKAVRVSSKPAQSTSNLTFLAKNNVDNSDLFDTKKTNQSNKNEGFWAILIATILAGFLSTFTPCVFPMIPLTVSFFLKQNSSDSKVKAKFNALLYGLCIILIYVLISIPFHLFESLSPGIFNEISTNVYLNLIFFVVFVLFACSFLGAFEINIPSSLSTKSDKASSAGGIIGIFFMALTLIIVSFSCTGPALGFVLGSVLSSDGGAFILTTAMLGFGIGLALPFVFFAIFPRLISNLPKSGGWLNTVKVVFGFIELALAFKFLSNVDLVLQLHWLEREVFIAIWIAIFLLLSFYLFEKIKLPHDDDTSRLSVSRLLLGMFTLSFSLYMIPGLWGAPLNLISAFPPPQHYSESPFGVGFSKISDQHSTTQVTALPKGAKLLPPHNIVAFTDYDMGLAYAKKVNKPVMLDFTGHACVNCRKMEQNVWAKSEVLSILKNDVVLVSLYVDDKRKLPESEVISSKLRPGKNLRYVGEKWSEFQTINFMANSQPFYVLVDLDGKKINEPIAYTPNAKKYLEWLSGGVEKFALTNSR